MTIEPVATGVYCIHTAPPFTEWKLGLCILLVVAMSSDSMVQLDMSVQCTILLECLIEGNPIIP